jgi:hypothetical protein
VIVSGIAIGLEDAVELLEKLFRSLAGAPHAEVKDRTTARGSVLP